MWILQILILDLSNINLKYQKINHSTCFNVANRVLKNVTFAVPLKYFSKFQRSLEIPIISRKVELKLTWAKYCVLSAGSKFQ